MANERFLVSTTASFAFLTSETFLSQEKVQAALAGLTLPKQFLVSWASSSGAAGATVRFLTMTHVAQSVRGYLTSLGLRNDPEIVEKVYDLKLGKIELRMTIKSIDGKNAHDCSLEDLVVTPMDTRPLVWAMSASEVVEAQLFDIDTKELIWKYK